MDMLGSGEARPLRTVNLPDLMAVDNRAGLDLLDK